MNLSEKINHLIDPILSIDNWKDRYQYLINLGNTIPEYPIYLKTENRRINGCQSNAYLDIYEEKGRLYISGTADSIFICGFIHLIILLYNRELIEDISSEQTSFISRIGFQEMVNPVRGKGLLAIYQKIKNYQS